jgi:hypothetical protein
MTGRIGPPGELNPILGIAYAAAPIAAGLILRGQSPRLRLASPFALTLAGRCLFHAWFEADNAEWLILPVVLVVAFGSGLTHGMPATPIPWRRVGVAMLVGLALWLLIAHGQSTWEMRDRSFMRVVERAASFGKESSTYVAAGIRADQALTLLRIPHRTVAEGHDAVERLAAELNRFPDPTIVIWDRGLIDGMPYTVRHRHSFKFEYDTVQLPAEFERLEQDGMLYGVRWTPPPPASPEGQPR